MQSWCRNIGNYREHHVLGQFGELFQIGHDGVLTPEPSPSSFPLRIVATPPAGAGVGDAAPTVLQNSFEETERDTQPGDVRAPAQVDQIASPNTGEPSGTIAPEILQSKVDTPPSGEPNRALVAESPPGKVDTPPSGEPAGRGAAGSPPGKVDTPPSGEPAGKVADSAREKVDTLPSGEPAKVGTLEGAQTGKEGSEPPADSASLEDENMSMYEDGSYWKKLCNIRVFFLDQYLHSCGLLVLWDATSPATHSCKDAALHAVA